LPEVRVSNSVEPKRASLLAHTARIVAAHAARNKLGTEGLTQLINDIYRVLRDLDGVEPPPAAKPQPAVAVKKSVFPDYIICLEDGKKLKMLKRHLRSAYNMSPEEYRAKWDLPPEYPMVAENYVRHRSSMAKTAGLGTNRRKKR
jgi:predicted transcriptional regulator